MGLPQVSGPSFDGGVFRLCALVDVERVRSSRTPGLGPMSFDGGPVSRAMLLVAPKAAVNMMMEGAREVSEREKRAWDSTRPKTQEA
jgi:hypothetical protein